jgi:prevent-host-death family protein
MLNVSVDNIVPITQARFKISQMVEKVRKSKDFLVLTKLGRPSVALVDIDFLGELIRYRKIGGMLEEARETFKDYLLKKGLSLSKIASLKEEEVEKLLLGQS